VLVASFGSLRLVEMELVQAIGVGGAVCVGSAVLVNLTLVCFHKSDERLSELLLLLLHSAFCLLLLWQECSDAACLLLSQLPALLVLGGPASLAAARCRLCSRCRSGRNVGAAGAATAGSESEPELDHKQGSLDVRGLMPEAGINSVTDLEASLLIARQDVDARRAAEEGAVSPAASPITSPVKQKKARAGQAPPAVTYAARTQTDTEQPAAAGGALLRFPRPTAQRNNNPAGKRRSFWLAVGLLTRRRRVGVVLFTLLLSLPFGLLAALRLRYSIDQTMLVPRGSASLAALHAIQKAPGLSSGGLVPIFVSLDRQGGGGGGGLRLNCTDDDYDLAYYCENHGVDRAVPAALRNCRAVREVMKCFPEGAPDFNKGLHSLAKDLCPGRVISDCHFSVPYQAPARPTAPPPPAPVCSSPPSSPPPRPCGWQPPLRLACRPPRSQTSRPSSQLGPKLPTRRCCIATMAAAAVTGSCSRNSTGW
jgi:hypothetical protein